MSQSYFPNQPRSVSPIPRNDPITQCSTSIELTSNAEDIQEAFLRQRDRLAEGLATTKSILGELRQFNKSSWVVRYPHVNASTSSSKSTTNPLRRAISFADEPGKFTDVIFSTSNRGLQRSMTLASVHEEPNQSAEETGEATTLPPSEFRVLRLDLKMGAGVSPSTLVSQLEKSSIANLLDDRFESSIKHVDNLHTRIQDTSSKVLVTGDLNAGKSTLVNALLRREVMPVDQQPCTTMFCEVIDAAENSGVEEVHIVKEGATYSSKDESTFNRAQISDLENIVTESDAQHILKMYVKDARNPQESLLNNGVVDIALIDAPGLNRDSLKTTALFARQEEIDVIVFVVSAENHFTLSAKEFLLNASNEKAYVFIVVNRFDQIKDKARCKRLVLEQIKQLSPMTWENAEELVHFVDSHSALTATESAGAFGALESALRSFVLVKRTRSKLAPAATYLEHLLSDIDLLVGSNAILAQKEFDQALEDLDRARPILEKMKKGRDGLDDSLENIEEEAASKASTSTQERLTLALEHIGKGELAQTGVIVMPSYPGLLCLWDYARDVRKVLLASLDYSVKLAEDEARVITKDGVAAVAQLAEEYLPEGVERSRRVFMPEAMFYPRNRKSNRNKRYSGGAIVAGGTHGLGIGLAQRTDLLEVSFFDVFDVQHHVSVHLGDGDKTLDDKAAGALSIVSLGVGALTMVGGKAIGVRGLVEGVIRISDFLGNESSRKWAAPVVGAVTLGLTVYFVLELPNSIPRNVGRHIKARLTTGEVERLGGGEDTQFINAHATRIGREARKVVRLVSWDTKERYRGAMEEKGKEVRGAEESQRKAEAALGYFDKLQKKTSDVRSQVGLGTL